MQMFIPNNITRDTLQRVTARVCMSHAAGGISLY